MNRRSSTRREADRVRARRWSAAGWQPSGVVSVLSDFGVSDPYVGIMKGVVLGAAPQVRVVDLTHMVPPQNVVVGALLLRSAVAFFPPGTVHLAVVDPGVGSARDPLVVTTDDAVLVGPDNGLLQPSAERLGFREARRIEASQYFLDPVSDTFHGRDIFAPIAGQIAAGQSPQEMGPLLESMQSLDLPSPHREGGAIVGRVIHVDHFGNLVTNIEIADVFDSVVEVRAGAHRLGRLVRSYAEVGHGEVVAIGGSWGMLEISVRDGSAATALALGRGDEIEVVIAKGDA